MELRRKIVTKNNSRIAVLYLVDVWERISGNTYLGSGAEWTTFIASFTDVVMRSLGLVMTGMFASDAEAGVVQSSPLSCLFIRNHQSFPLPIPDRARFVELLVTASRTSGTFPQIFNTLLFDHMGRAKNANILDKSILDVFHALECLTGVKIATARPTACLVPLLEVWCPDLITTGKQLENYSFLGPFLGVSAYLEENTRIEKDKEMDLEFLKQEIPPTMRSLRDAMFKIVYNLLLPKENRDNVLKYFAKVLNMNAKKSGIQAREEVLAGDGFMLNFLSVMLDLSTKVVVEKVDTNYFQSPNCRSVDQKLHISVF